MSYQSEAAKVRDMINVMQYITGNIIDIGAGHDPITPKAFAVDGRELPGINYVTDDVLTLTEQLQACAHMPFNTVFSSHFLEHIADQYGAVKDWSGLLARGGHLVLYLPDGRHYNNKENPEHMIDMNYDQFIFWFKRSFCGEGKDFRGNHFQPIFELIEHGMDVGVDRYSFYVVAKRL